MPRDDMTREAAEEILELPRRYTKEDLRRSYTEMARRYHPDAAAKHHFDAAAAQTRMVEANKAYELLKRQFKERPDRVVERVSAAGIAQGFAGVDWNGGASGSASSGAGVYGSYDPSADPWDFVDDLGADPVPQKPPLSVRSVLLGPVVLRVLFIALFAWLWWCTFPLLPQNASRFVPAPAWTLLDVARAAAAVIYPTYVLLYEAFSGYVSDFVREVLNGVVSWVMRSYVDLRPRSASYGCALYKLLHEQYYALLMLPGALALAGLCVAETQLPIKIVYGVLAGALSLDTLAAVTRGGFVNVWTTALSERVEARYLLIRASLLRHCGQWDNA